MRIKLAEVFASIQGEGRLMGVPSTFLRTTGCNLRCRFCDTPYSSWQPEGTFWELEDILNQVAALPARHVVLTGGEPLLLPGLVDLCAALRQRGYHVTVETAATVFRPLSCDLMSLSPKLSNSTPAGRFAAKHEQLRWRPAIIQALSRLADYQLKFVIDRPDDVVEVLVALQELPGIEREKVLLMPQGVTCTELTARSEWLQEACRRHRLGFCPRRHIELWGNLRGR